MKNKYISRNMKIGCRLTPRRIYMPNTKKTQTSNMVPSALISKKIKELDDWRGKTLGKIREIIKEADPQIVEEWKWGTPVWSHNGLICTGETYKDHIKMTFAKGKSLKDPDKLFTQDGTVRRAIDIHEGESINEAALKNLIRAAVELNLKGKKSE
jgi:hypothetical protein